MKSVIFAEVYKLVTDDAARLSSSADSGNITLCHLQITRAFFQSTVHGTNLRTKSFTKVLKTCADRKSFFGECTLGTSVNDLQEELSHSSVDSVTYKVGVQRLQNGSSRKNLSMPLLRNGSYRNIR